MQRETWCILTQCQMEMHVVAFAQNAKNRLELVMVALKNNIIMHINQIAIVKALMKPHYICWQRKSSERKR